MMALRRLPLHQNTEEQASYTFGGNENTHFPEGNNWMVSAERKQLRPTSTY